MVGVVLGLAQVVLDWAYRLQRMGYALRMVEGLVPRAWCAAFRARALTTEEIEASREVHPDGLIPYGRVRVTERSLLSRLGGERAMATMYVLHSPRRPYWDLSVAVHELSHVAQYRRAGLKYIPQALYAQAAGGGYDYGDLTYARAAGKRFRDFNREQQAQMIQDYYRLRHELEPRYRVTLAQLEPYMIEMRRGEF